MRQRADSWSTERTGLGLKRTHKTERGTAEKLLNFSILRSRRRYPRAPPKIAGLSAMTAIGLELEECLAGAGGFEPPHGGIKIRRN